VWQSINPGVIHKPPVSSIGTPSADALDLACAAGPIHAIRSPFTASAPFSNVPYAPAPAAMVAMFAPIQTLSHSVSEDFCTFDRLLLKAQV
jgi:hypothetical protein